MSLSARLHLDGHSKESEGLKVLSCDFSFSQDTDGRGQQSSKVKAGLINVTLNSVDDAEIVQWALGRSILKSGKIAFSGVIDTGPKRSIGFEDALLVNYYESFSDQSDISISLSISARVIKISGAKHDCEWNPSAMV